MSCQRLHVQVQTAHRDLNHLAKRAGRTKYGPSQKVVTAIAEAKATIASQKQTLADYHADNGCDMEGTP